MFANITHLYKRVIAGLLILCSILLVIIIIGGIAISQMPQTIRIATAPDLAHRNNIFLATEKASNEAVYAFAAYWLPFLYSWQKDGGEDYVANSVKIRALLSQRLRLWINADIKARDRQGRLRNRVRTARVIPANPDKLLEHVRKLASGGWEVKVPMHIKEHFANQSSLIIDDVVVYTVLIKHSNVHEQYNPWGLEIDAILSVNRN